MKPPEEERERGPRGTGQPRGPRATHGPRPARQVSVNGAATRRRRRDPPAGAWTGSGLRAPGCRWAPCGGTEAPHALRSCRPPGDGRVWGRDAEGETAKRNRKTSKRKGKRFPNRWATQGAMAGELGRPRPAGARKASHMGARRPGRKTQERGPESRRESTTFHAGSKARWTPTSRQTSRAHPGPAPGRTRLMRDEGRGFPGGRGNRGPSVEDRGSRTLQL